MASTTLLAHLGSAGTDLTRLVGGIDAQSLSYGDFDVVFVVDAPGHPQQQRLEELAARRPNVRVVSNADGLASLGSGEWLVYLSPQVLGRAVQLRPRALELLARHAAGAASDIVVARTDSAGHVHDVFAGGSGRATADLLSGPFAVAYRRSFAAQHGVARDAADAERIAGAAGTVAAFGDYAVLTDTGRPAPVADRPVSFRQVTAEWVDGRLRAQVDGTTRAAGELVFAVQNADGEQYRVGEPRPVAAGEPFSAIVDIDVTDAALGAALAPGVWQLRVHVHDPAGTAWVAQVPVSAARIRPAVLAGSLVAPARGEVFAFDIGATAGSAVPRFAAADVTIVETAAGTLLTAPLPNLYATGSAEIPGYLLLDKFKLPAALSIDDGVVALTCKLSGLAGTAALGTQFGAGRPAPTGLSLDISPTGQMTVVRTPKAAAAKKSATPAKPGPFLTRVRRTLARNETARRVYTRFAKR